MCQVCLLPTVKFVGEEDDEDDLDDEEGSSGEEEDEVVEGEGMSSCCASRFKCCVYYCSPKDHQINSTFDRLCDQLCPVLHKVRTQILKIVF